MKCPKCDQLVDPLTDGTWFDVLTRGKGTAKAVLMAIRRWDESAMYYGNQSVLPTELRDAVRKHTGYYE